MFDTGPQFVFNLGGGPGFRVHQFGGGAPRRRPTEANGQQQARPQNAFSFLSNLLPLLILFVLPLLSSIFSASMPSGPSIHFAPGPPNTMHRVSQQFNVDYYLNPTDVTDYNARKMRELDKQAEQQFISTLQYECQIETRNRNRMVEEAQGWFFPDVNKMRDARNYDRKACRRLEGMGFATRQY